jgi:hypothetical protein
MAALTAIAVSQRFLYTDARDARNFIATFAALRTIAMISGEA